MYHSVVLVHIKRSLNPNETRAQICIWDYPSRKLRHKWDTGHTDNIFCAKFVSAHIRR